MQLNEQRANDEVAIPSFKADIKAFVEEASKVQEQIVSLFMVNALCTRESAN